MDSANQDTVCLILFLFGAKLSDAEPTQLGEVLRQGNNNGCESDIDHMIGVA